MNAKIDVAIGVLTCDLFIFSYTGEVFAPFLSCLSSVPGVVHYCTPVFVIVCYLIKNAFHLIRNVEENGSADAEIPSEDNQSAGESLSAPKAEAFETVGVFKLGLFCDATKYPFVILWKLN